MSPSSATASLPAFAQTPATPAATSVARPLTTGKSDAPTATRFAQILQNRTTEKAAAPVKVVKADTTSDDDADTTEDKTADGSTDAATAVATPDDLTAAADEAVSAVLALLGLVQPTPTAAPKTSTSTLSTDGDATAPAMAMTSATPQIPARLFAMASPSSPLTSGTAATKPTTAIPVDPANLSPADQQLLRTMSGALSPSTAEAAGQGTTPADAAGAAAVAIAAGATAPATAADPQISPLASALNSALQSGAASPTSPTVSGKVAATTAPIDGGTKTAPPPLPTPIAPIAVQTMATTTADTGAADQTDPATDMSHAKHAAAGDDIPLPDDGAVLAPVDNNNIVAQATAPTSTIDAATTGTSGPVVSQGEQSITRHLDLARDNQWLDKLAQDINQAATQNSHLKFQLNPEHLGSLQVEITNSAAGASIRLTADNDSARAIIADAQPRLMAEVRAQGLRVAESHVDLGNQASSGGASGQRQSSEDHKPFVRTQVGTSEQASDSAKPDDELYA